MFDLLVIIFLNAWLSNVYLIWKCVIPLIGQPSIPPCLPPHPPPLPQWANSGGEVSITSLKSISSANKSPITTNTNRPKELSFGGENGYNLISNHLENSLG